MQYLRRCLFFSLLLLAIVQMGFAQVSVTLPDTTGTKPDTMFIPILVGDLTDLNVISAEFNVNYDPNVVQAIGITQAGTITESWTKSTRVTPGQISIVLANSLPAEGSGRFLYIRFRLLPDASPDSTFLTFSHAVFNEGEPALSASGGKIRILAIHVSPGSSTLYEGDQQQFAVSGDVTMPVTWETTNTSVATIDNSGLLTAETEGFCRVVAVDDAGLADTSGFVIVRPIELRNLTISIHDTSFTQQLSFSLPVYISSVNSLGIISAQFSLHFQPNHLVPLGVTTDGSMTAGWNNPEVNLEHDYVTIAIAGTEALADSGVFIYFDFRVRPTASGSSSLSLSDVLFNEEILANTEDGIFTPLPAPAIVISPDHPILTQGDQQQFSVSGGTAPYSWSVTDTAVASINNSGLLTTQTSGLLRVVVNDVEAFTDSSSTVTVNDLKVTFPDTAVQQGFLVDMPVFVDREITPFGVISYQFTATYLDTPVIWVDTVITAGTLSENWDNVAFSDTNGAVTIAAAGSDPLTGSAPLIKLRFYSANDAPIGLESGLAFSQFMMNEGNPSATLENGSLQIVSSSIPDVHVYLPDTSASPGETILVPLRINNTVDDLGILSFEFEVAYDESILTAGNAETTGTMSEGYSVQTNVATAGTVSVAASGTTELVGQGTLINLEFQVVPMATGSTDLTFVSFRFNEGDPNGIAHDGSLSVTPVNHDPVARDDTVSTDEDTPVVIHALRNDSDQDGDSLKITEVHVTDSGGSAVINAGDTTLTYTPGQDWTNDDQVLYTISDGNGGTDQATVLIHINPINDPPRAFALISPVDSTEIIFMSGDLDVLTLSFSWETAIDPDGDDVEYGFVPTDGTLDVIAWDDTTATEVTYSYSNLVATMDNAGYDIIDGDWTIFATDGEDTTYADDGPRYLRLDATELAVIPESGIPISYQLFQNYPNPFNPVTQVKYGLPEQTFVNISVYDLLGNKVVTLVNQSQSLGYHIIEWNGRNDAGQSVGAGFYFCRMHTAKQTIIRKMVYMK